MSPKLNVIALILAALSTVVTGCDDTSFQKVPTEVNVVFGVSANGTANPSFDGGYIYLSSFEFEGRRTAGDDVNFELEFEPQLKVMFDSSISLPELQFEIPQGEYYRIDVRFETDDLEWEPNVLALGTYTSATEGSIAVRFELESSEHFDIKASGGDPITLTKDVAKDALIQFDPNTWFEIVPYSMFDNADKTYVDGKLTIVVSEENNEDIFELVVNRMEESCIVEFIDE